MLQNSRQALRIAARLQRRTTAAATATAVALAPSSSSLLCIARSSLLHTAPRRCFADNAAPAAVAPAPTGGRRGRGGAGADAAAPSADELSLAESESIDDAFNMIPPIPKPSPQLLAELHLSQEELRFSMRPQPSPAVRHEQLPTIYIDPARPIASHTRGDIGKYFHVPHEVQRSIPNALQRAMSTELMGGGNHMMVRQPALNLVASLKKIMEKSRAAAAGKQQPQAEESNSNASESSATEGAAATPSTSSSFFSSSAAADKQLLKRRVFGLRGSSGCGKSATLHYAAQYIREHNRLHPSHPWLLIATRAQEFACETKGFIQPSATKPEVYDQALYTMDFFANLVRSEEHTLKLIKLKRTDKLADVAWPAGEGSEAGTRTLYDLALLASQDRAQAPRLLYEFVAELRLPTEIPVAILVDDLNVWDQVSPFVEPLTYEPLPPRKLALVDAFSYFTRKAPKNGACAWAITTRHATLADTYRHFSFPQVQGLDTYWYSVNELKHCIVHYSVSDFILSEVNQELLVRVAGLTGRVPRDVFKQAFFR